MDKIKEYVSPPTKTTEILTQKLPFEQQREILSALFGFEFYNQDGRNVLYDEYDEEFYGQSGNAKFNFSTLESIFAYTAHRAKEQGYADAQRAIRKSMGLN